MNREDEQHDERAEPRGDTKPREKKREGSGRTKPVQFLREVRSELRKVAWPNRKEVTSYTIVVLVTTLVLTAIVWGMDEVFRQAVINTLG